MAKIALTILLISLLSVCATQGKEIDALKTLMKPSTLDKNEGNDNNEYNRNNKNEIPAFQMANRINNTLNIDFQVIDERARQDFEQAGNARTEDSTLKPVLTSFLGNFQTVENADKPEIVNKRLIEIALRQINIFNMIWKEKFLNSPPEEKRLSKKGYIDALANGLIGRK